MAKNLKKIVEKNAGELSHLDAQGQATQVDVGAKPITARSATARAVLRLPPAVRQVLAAGGDTAKGNVFAVARLAAIMAARKTADLIPLCHPLPLDGVAVEITLVGDEVDIRATVRCHARTGVEMEALTAASVGALTCYDMVKAISHDVVIQRIELLEKTGGKRGHIRRQPSGDQP